MDEWKCRKCGVSLVKKKTVFDYMGRTFSEELYKCPKCGLVFIPADLAKGRMAEVEETLEDK